jgi:hypothetical protein
VLFPSRSPVLAQRLIDSLWECAATYQWACLVGVDPGDNRTGQANVTHYTLPAALYFTDRTGKNDTLFRCTWAINWLAKQAKDATHFWALNDDVVVDEIAWDRRILALEPGQLGLTDLTPASGWHSNFPAFTRAHLDEFGTLFHPNFWGWGADHWICRTAALARRAHWLHIELAHDQADLGRQRRIQAHQPPPPSPAVRADWIRRLQAIAQKKGAGTAPTPKHKIP